MLKNQPIRHFLDLDLIEKDWLQAIIRQGHLYKKQAHVVHELLKAKNVALIFEKPSTRTRLSFEVAVRELGGFVSSMTGKEMQLGHGETIADTARVMSRFVQAAVLRIYEHADLLEFAKHATIPVINGLTNFSHPCQVMADLMTVEERLRVLKGLTIAWCGDGDNNVLYSWMHAAAHFDFDIRVACPDAYSPDAAFLAAQQKKARISVCNDPHAAASGAHVVITDTWISMHHKDADARRAALMPFQVTPAVMAKARKDAVFLHCLPAHRGEEVVDAVIDGPQSAIWDEAENRLHVQKAILLYCFNILQRG